LEIQEHANIQTETLARTHPHTNTHTHTHTHTHLHTYTQAHIHPHTHKHTHIQQICKRTQGLTSDVRDTSGPATGLHEVGAWVRACVCPSLCAYALALLYSCV
jgi:hypothetical protein